MAESDDATRALVRSAYFFRSLADPVVEEIARACRHADFEAGATVFREGDAGDELFLVVHGEIEVWKHHESADRSLLARYGAGRFFGEMALVDELPRSATAVAAVDSHLLALARSDFHGLVMRYPELAMSVMRSLSAIVRESNESFVADLYRRNQELESAYRQLENAQSEILLTERLSNLGKMSDMILHDIRNPTAVIKGYAEMLRRVANQPDRVRDFARRVETEAHRLSHLAGELLDYARGEIRLDMSVARPGEVIDAAIGYVEDRYRNGGVAIERTVEDDAPAVFDYNRMVRALLNLLDNALKATASGGCVTVSSQRTAGRLLFEVRDDGEGMAPEVRARVFEPFYSRSGSGGTGLGMVIVKNIVEAHGGRLTLESHPGEGTMVRISVPGTI